MIGHLIRLAFRLLRLWQGLGILSIGFHLALVFSGLVPALVARPLHMALALPWLFVFAPRSRLEAISGWVVLVLGDARVCLRPWRVAAIDRLGPVEWLVAPNSLHYWYVADWQRLYPAARTLAVPGLADHAKRPFRVDAVVDADDAPLPGGLRAVLVPGTAVTEAVFFHEPSRTVILTDLIENFEPQRVRSRFYRWLVRLSGAAHPDGKAPIDLRLTFWPRRRRVRAAMATILGWDCERVVMAHGLPYASDGAAELRRAFRWAV